MERTSANVKDFLMLDERASFHSIFAQLLEFNNICSTVSEVLRLA